MVVNQDLMEYAFRKYNMNYRSDVLNWKHHEDPKHSAINRLYIFLLRDMKTLGWKMNSHLGSKKESQLKATTKEILIYKEIESGRVRRPAALK